MSPPKERDLKTLAASLFLSRTLLKEGQNPGEEAITWVKPKKFGPILGQLIPPGKEEEIPTKWGKITFLKEMWDPFEPHTQRKG